MAKEKNTAEEGNVESAKEEIKNGSEAQAEAKPKKAAKTEIVAPEDLNRNYPAVH